MGQLRYQSLKGDGIREALLSDLIAKKYYNVTTTDKWRNNKVTSFGSSHTEVKYCTVYQSWIKDAMRGYKTQWEGISVESNRIEKNCSDLYIFDKKQNDRDTSTGANQRYTLVHQSLIREAMTLTRQLVWNVKKCYTASTEETFLTKRRNNRYS